MKMQFLSDNGRRLSPKKTTYGVVRRSCVEAQSGGAYCTAVARYHDGESQHLNKPTHSVFCSQVVPGFMPGNKKVCLDYSFSTDVQYLPALCPFTSSRLNVLD